MIPATAEVRKHRETFGIPAETKWSYATGIVPADQLHDVQYDPDRVPKAGDVVLGRVMLIGRHTQIEYPSGRKARLFPGDVLGLVCGSRYATDQFEGYVPRELGPAHLLSVGGTCGEVVSRSATCLEPTTIDLLGYVHSPLGPITLRQYGLRPMPINHRARVVLVTGNSMNSGKTTTAVQLIRGLVRQGFRVAAGKVTGTGCGNDPFQLLDAGATPVLDFLSVGYESTYMCSNEDLLRIHRTLMSNLLAHRPDFVVLEIADGLLQRETATLLASPEVLGSVDYIIHCIADPLAARAAVDLLRRRGLNPVALSGLVSSRPLAVKELALDIDIPVLSAEELAEGAFQELLERMHGESQPAMSAA